MVKKTALAFVVCLFLFVFTLARPSYSSVSSCTASLSVSSLATNSGANFGFDLNNSSDAQIVWVKITRPSANFTITGYTISGLISGSDSEVTAAGPIDPGNSMSFTITATTGDSAASSADWKVEVSDDSSGANSTSCGGSLGTEITQGAAPAPSISDIVVSNITSSAVTITWTTDQDSDSSIDYGADSAYGSNKADSSQTSAHAISLDSLSANTTYHYNIKSNNSNGGSESGDNTFVTAKAGLVAANTIGTTTTTTSSGSTTKTTGPIVTRDTQAPFVSISTTFDKPFAQAPSISGRASDNKSISKVEYSTDGGRSWSAVDEMASPRSSSTTFGFTPVIFEDGNYQVKVRAIDSSGNIGSSPVYTMVVDRLPPEVGGSFVSIGPQELAPDASGYIYALAGLDQKITLSAVGGPVTIDLLSRSKMFSLVKNTDNGLWSGTLSFQAAGVYPLAAVSMDGAGNKTNRSMESIVVLSRGKILGVKNPVKDARVSLFYLAPSEGKFALWDGASYGQKNPQKTNKDGEYSLFIPAGTYYMEVEAPGFRIFKSDIFKLDKATPMSASVNLEKQQAFKFFFLTLPIPDFTVTSAKISTSLPSRTSQKISYTSLIGQEIPEGDLKIDNTTINTSDFRGKPTLVTFVNTWLPSAAQQLSILENASSSELFRTVVVIPQETSSKVSIYKKRGGYGLPMYADPDGILVKPLNLQSLPTHVFLDRKGRVTAVKSGILSEEEISSIFQF